MTYSIFSAELLASASSLTLDCNNVLNTIFSYLFKELKAIEVTNYGSVILIIVNAIAVKPAINDT